MIRDFANLIFDEDCHERTDENWMLLCPLPMITAEIRSTRHTTAVLSANRRASYANLKKPYCRTTGRPTRNSRSKVDRHSLLLLPPHPPPLGRPLFPRRFIVDDGGRAFTTLRDRGRRSRWPRPVVSGCLDQVGKSLEPAPTRFKQNAVSGVAPRPLTNHQGATIRSAPEPFPAHDLLLFEGPEG